MDTRCDIGHRDKTWCHSHPLARVAAISTAVLVGMGVTACKETWEGFVYPDRGDLTRHAAIGSFESLEACRAAAHRTLEDMHAVEGGDYECGKNCRTESNLPGLRVCKETLR